MSARIPPRHQGIICLISIALLSFLMVILVNGCGGSYPSTPDKVMIEFSKAYVNQDLKKAGNYCTSRFKSMPFFTIVDQALSAKVQSLGVKLSEDQRKVIIEWLNTRAGDYEYSIEGNTAKVWRGTKFVTFLFVKEGGRWKLDGFDTTDIRQREVDLKKGELRDVEK